MSDDPQLEQIKQQCPFCRISRKEIPSKEVFCDDSVMAVLDINPATKGHTVAFPREHYMLVAQMPPQEQFTLFDRVGKLCRAVRKGAVGIGTTVFLASGGAAGQQAYHTTVHIIPRDPKDGLDKFTIPLKELPLAEVQKLQAPLLQHITARVMQGYKSAQKEPPQVLQGGQKSTADLEKLFAYLNSNKQLMQLIMVEPEKFKQILPQNPELAQMFQGVDIDALSAELKKQNQGVQQ